MPSTLHLAAAVLLAAANVLLLIVLIRPALERRRDLRAWEAELSYRPVEMASFLRQAASLRRADFTRRA